MGNIGDSPIGLLVASLCLLLFSPKCPLFINEEGKFAIFSNPSQINYRGITGERPLGLITLKLFLAFALMHKTSNVQ
jgi:hypothetical protein